MVVRVFVDYGYSNLHKTSASIFDILVLDYKILNKHGAKIYLSDISIDRYT